MKPISVDSVPRLRFFLVSIVFLLIILAVVFFRREVPKVGNESSGHIKIFASKLGIMPYEDDASAYGLFTFAKAVFGELIYLGKDFHLHAKLIKDWRWNFENKTYELTLDTSRRFHNGRNFECLDVEFLIARTFLTPKSLLDSTWLKNVAGTEKLVRGQPFKPGMIEGCRCISPSQMTIRLKKPDPTFLYIFAHFVPSLYPREELNDDLVTFKSFPIGAGEYRVTAIDKQKGFVRLKRFTPPTPDQQGIPTIVDMYVAGDPVEIKPDIVLASLKNYGDYDQSFASDYRSVLGAAAVGVGLLTFNFKTELGALENFRKAINIGLDRKFVIDGFVRKVNTPLNEILPAGFQGRLNLPLKTDIEQAKKLMATIPKHLLEREYTAYFHGNADQPEYIIRIKKQLADLGVRVNFQKTSKIKIDDETKESLIYISGVPSDFTDPLNVFGMFLSSSSRPYQRPADNHRFDELYEQVTEEPELEKASVRIQKLSQYVVDTALVVPFYEMQLDFSVHKRIKTLGTQVSGLALDLEQVRVEQ